MSNFILSIDQGTTGSTAMLVNKLGQCVERVNEEYPQIFPKPGWVEHDPEQIWESVCSVIQKVLQKAHVDGQQIAAIGITNQRETCLFWDRIDGRPLGHALVWQDRRTSIECEKLKKEKKEGMIRRLTGLVIDPYFSGTKAQWMIRHWPHVKAALKQGRAKFGTIDSFLVWRLSGGQAHVTDPSNASRTLLFDIHKKNWSPELLKLFGVPRAALPEVRGNADVLAHTRSVPGLPDGIPISGIAGDQQAALFGQACFDAGQAKCTFGTGSFLLLNTGTKPLVNTNGCLTTVAWSLKGQTYYALEGSVFICGAAVQWLRDGLKLIAHSSDIENLAKAAPDTGGVFFVPALTGLGAPYWDPNARGIICGLTRGTTQSHIARATLEAMAFQNAELLQIMGTSRKVSVIKVDGGAAANDLLMQMQADFSGIPCIRPKMIETTALGAAFFAGLGVGFWSGTDELKKVWSKDRQFHPELKFSERKRRLEAWRHATKRALSS